MCKKVLKITQSLSSPSATPLAILVLLLLTFFTFGLSTCPTWEQERGEHGRGVPVCRQQQAAGRRALLLSPDRAIHLRGARH